ncbi:hypothetical protein R80B4_01744 [Fibrobacteres bacterium R8-0-B4]
MTENRLVLDTNAVIFLTTVGSVIPADLEKELDGAELFISVITEIELFARPTLSSDEEKCLRAFLSDRVHVIDLTSEIKHEVIVFRRSTKHKLPDCIVAATAIVLDAMLLTADSKLLHIKWPGFKTKSFI